MTIVISAEIKNNHISYYSSKKCVIQTSSLRDIKRVLPTVILGCLLGQKRQPVVTHHCRLGDFALTARPYRMASNVTDGSTDAKLCHNGVYRSEASVQKTEKRL